MRLEDLQGRKIGRYELKGVLGRGGMAAVYRAHDTTLRRDVALKILYPQFGDDTSLIERFQREAVLAAGLDHPNIVPIYDVGEAEGLTYIAMKLLDGRSLADLLRERPTLPPAELVPIIDQIAAALDYAHRRGIVHRDIKTANIMIERPGTGGQRAKPTHAMLTDFGIAKSLDSAGLTTSGVLIGTPDYMAPEQIGQGAVDGRADIYALGVVAFRCLTGRRPFEGGTEQVLIAHLQGEIPDASMIEGALPTAVDPVLRKALAKRPEQRYATAGEFARALGAALGFETLTPPPALRRDSDARAVVPGIAAARIAQPPTSADLPTQRGTSSAAPPRPERTPPPRPVPAPVRAAVAPRAAPASNTGPIISVLLLLVALVGGSFLLYRALAADTSALGTAIVVPPVPPLATAPAQATSAPLLAEAPTLTAAPTAAPAEAPPTAAPAEAPPTAAPAEAPPTATAPPAPPTSAPVIIVQSPTPLPPTSAPPTAAPTALPPTAAPPTAAPVACAIEPVRGFLFVLQNNPQVRERVGCPRQNEVASTIGEQPFERGGMLWYRTGDIFYVLKGSNAAAIKGTWEDFTKDQVDAVKGNEPPPIDEPPSSALFIPRKESGFYYIWVFSAGIRQALGYALTPSEAETDGAAYQSFEGGTMLFTPSGFGTTAMIYVLYRDGSFERYRDTSATAPN